MFHQMTSYIATLFSVVFTLYCLKIMEMSLWLAWRWQEIAVG
jgi:hypothetical protein